MRPADEHLDPQEIEWLVYGTAGPSGYSAGHILPATAQQHLNMCALCQATVGKHRRAEAILKSLNAGSKQPIHRGEDLTPAPDCPVEQTWLSLAAGLMSRPEVEHYIKHAAICDGCGSRLKEYLEDLAPDVSPEEQKVLDSLPTSSPNWQRNMAKKLALLNRSPETAEPMGQLEVVRKPPLKTWPRLVWIGSLAVIAFVLWMYIEPLRQPKIEELLAKAYTEQRSMDVRISGAQYSPLQLQRGEQRPLTARSVSLLKAEELIALNLSKHGSDPRWLQAKARADLLDGNCQAAIGSLQMLLKSNSNSSSLLTDLATGYFLRAEATGKSIDYENAVEALSQALASTPDDPVALFNRAIVSERAGLYTQAINDWEHYLRIDSDSLWANDARQRLAALRERLKTMRQ